MPLKPLHGALALGLVAGPSLWAEALLFDFEAEADLQVWHDEGQTILGPGKSVARIERFATSGRFSLCFAVPAWKAGQPEWPAFECTPPRTDWSGFDRLVFDATNPTGAVQKVFFFISDSQVPTRQGWLQRTELLPYSYTQVVVPLSKLEEVKVNPADIHVMHCFTERPPADMEIYLDRFVLLRPGEPLPTAPTSFVQEFMPLQTARAAALRQRLREARGRLRKATAGVPEAAVWAEAELRNLDRQVRAFAERVSRADPALLQEGFLDQELQARLDSLEALAKLRSDFARVRPAVQVGRKFRNDVVVGVASSMEKVLPRAPLSPLSVADHIAVSLARNEKESFQIIVLPCERALKKVRVRVTDLRSDHGVRFPATQIDTAVVGYVQTQQEPPYGASHVGWWPDPILNFQQVTDIAVGDAQAFWVRVRAPKNQPAGLYRGKLEVVVDGVRTFSFPLAVLVYGFCLPDASPLPLAVTFWPRYFEPNPAGGWREGEYQDLSWKSHKFEWADFLADYYLSYDSLYVYAHWTPDFEVLERLHRQGRLGRFNLGYYGICGESPAEIEAWRKSTLEVLRPRYEKAKALGLLDHAYIYGCDEHPADLFPGVERAAQMLKAEFPGVLILTTTYDHSFGQESVLQSMDAFCPLIPSFDPQRAAQAGAAGKQVWWYICCGPYHPYPNMFIEYPAIEGRLLMGAMTAKYRPDGFLYYQISIWNSPPITSGPFTDWNPRSWTTYHGDGSWTCLGPDGTPLPTLRLENFRDGLEDYVYFRILEATIAKVEASPELRSQRAAWLEKSKALLEVPDDVVKSLTEYTHDPAKVYQYRQALAQAIEEAGLPPQ